MNAMFVPHINDSHWFSECFPTLAFSALPLAARPWVDYVADFCVLLKATSLCIVEPANADQPCSQWPLERRWLPAPKASLSLQELAVLADEHAADDSSDSLLFVCGAVLPVPKEPAAAFAAQRPLSQDDCAASSPTGVFVRTNGAFYVCDMPVLPLHSFSAYFDANFALLSSPQCHVLRGYATQGQSRFGIRSHISSRARVEGDVLLGDQTCVERDCALEGGALLGNDVFVSRGSTLRHAILLDHAFVPPDSTIENSLLTASGKIFSVDIKSKSVLYREPVRG